MNLNYENFSFVAETILSSKVMRLLKKIHRIRREPDVDMKYVRLDYK